MSVEKARSCYTGKSGHRRMNCAQAVLSAFQEVFDVPDDVIEQCGSCGSGRAPEGQCGALYAARILLEKTRPEKIKDCEDALLSSAGSLKCREIRMLRKISCLGCVEKVAACIEASSGF